ncbi:PTS mannose transporter subunit IID [Niallia circulans]|jgi:D-glucosaminate PTS system EIID component|uniref:PTS mannose transporter subunit IID n=1 Tax=Niallia circulans TaxID=1397 RepID=A0A0J1IL21_NIACI|nr:PTS system mannose/fructose/sorbose family transporter subunit IID [Niallia circulans]AYV68140.1 PTS mannose transporter subunit IID [Niallia circulans]KLV26578.1 PTS mannose transporter subunit IID [Niallia circulans]MCM2983427.1 PTS system mannose/fructose/sorbose family transporter subunit IID [Niallia circulans]MDR4317582.1 PTS system mannose/fructose/sorbose family transporter subunit IID [Niallia circulans]MED3841032.1 PTS system mannose/fructose/sorbose family transporter subunit IID
MSAEEKKQSPENYPEPITKKDLLKAWARWWWANEIPHTFDRMVAPSFLFGMTPILKKLYKDKKDLSEAYQRHLLFFNTQAIWGGGTLTGITASLEESRAKALAEGKEEEAPSPDMINNTKVGLMGALAGIGDAIDSGTVQYIFIAIALPWAMAGSPLGALFPFLGFTLVTFLYGYYFVRMGYGLGRNAAKEILAGSRIKTMIDALSVLGLFMMGILAGSYVKVSSSLSFTLSEKQFVLQDILDSILPGLLPLLTVLGVYLYFDKKGFNITKGLLWLTGTLIVLGAIKVL